nr:MAG TPA: hypothetical protein [Caudoviricetes sp.]
MSGQNHQLLSVPSKNPLVEVEALWYPTYFGLLAEAYFH